MCIHDAKQMLVSKSKWDFFASCWATNLCPKFSKTAGGWGSAQDAIGGAYYDINESAGQTPWTDSLVPGNFVMFSVRLNADWKQINW